MPHQSSYSHSWEFRLPWLGHVSSTSTAKEGGKDGLSKLAKQPLLLQSRLPLPLFDNYVSACYQAILFRFETT